MIDKCQSLVSRIIFSLSRGSFPVLHMHANESNLIYLSLKASLNSTFIYPMLGWYSDLEVLLGSETSHGRNRSLHFVQTSSEQCHLHLPRYSVKKCKLFSTPVFPSLPPTSNPKCFPNPSRAVGHHPSSG